MCYILSVCEYYRLTVLMLFDHSAFDSVWPPGSWLSRLCALTAVQCTEVLDPDQTSWLLGRSTHRFTYRVVHIDCVTCRRE